MGFRVYTPGQLVSHTHFAGALASWGVGARANQALALLETSLAAAGEARKLEALLEGYRRAADTTVRKEYFWQAIAWIRSHPHQIERTLAAMRRRYVAGTNRFDDTQNLADSLRLVLAQPSPSRQQSTGLSLTSGGDVVPAEPAGRITPPVARPQVPDSRINLDFIIHHSQAFQLSRELRRGPSFLIFNIYEWVYRNAPKLQVRIEELGFDFEVALIRSQDLPEVAHFVQAGFLAEGFPFLVEDFFEGLPAEQRELFIKLKAVHLYGEALFGDHHLASKLELATASRFGVLEPYLEFLRTKGRGRFGDVALHRIKGPMLHHLPLMGFEISAPKILRRMAEPARFADPESPEAVQAQQMINRYPVSETVLERLVVIEKSDEELSESTRTEWILFTLSLEQVKAFYEQAFSDVIKGLESSSDSPLALKLSLFRALGVLEREREQKLVVDRYINPKLKDVMLRQLLRRIHGIIRDDAELNLAPPMRTALLTDPLFSASREAIEELARADSEIWLARDWELQLVPASGAEAQAKQREIEKLRQRAWSYAMAAGVDLERQTQALRHYLRVFVHFAGKIQAPLEKLFNAYRVGTVPAELVGTYLDEGDFAAALQAQFSEDILQLLNGNHRDQLLRQFVQERVDEALPAIWERQRRGGDVATAPFNPTKPQLVFALPAGETDLAVQPAFSGLEQARIAYLAAQSVGASFEVKRNIFSLLSQVLSSDPNRRFDRIREARQAGLIAEPLAQALFKFWVEHHPDALAERLLPAVENLPYQIAAADWNLDLVLQAYRYHVQSTMVELAGAHPDWLLQMLTHDVSLREQLHSIFVGKMKQVLRLMAPVVPEFKDLPPKRLWERAGLLPPPNGTTEMLQPADVEVSPALAFYLRPLPIPALSLPGPESIPRVRNLESPAGRGQLQEWLMAQQFLLLGDPRFLELAKPQQHLDLYALLLKRLLQMHFLRHRRIPPSRTKELLPADSLRWEELWHLHQRHGWKWSNAGLARREIFARFLGKIAALALDPSDAMATQILLEFGDKSPEAGLFHDYPILQRGVRHFEEFLTGLERMEGYDRHGTLGSGQRAIYLQALAQQTAGDWEKELQRHLRAVLRYYADLSLEGWSNPEIGVELAALALDVDPLKQPFFKAAFWTAAQLYLLWALHQGQRLVSEQEAFNYLTSEWVWLRRLAFEQFVKNFLEKQPEFEDVADKLQAALFEKWGSDVFGTVPRSEMIKFRRVVQDSDHLHLFSGTKLGHYMENYRTIVERLVNYPRRSKAKQELVTLYQDVVSIHRKIGFERKMRHSAPLLWEIRQAWLLVNIKEGRIFSDVREALNALPPDLDPRILEPELARSPDLPSNLSKQTGSPQRLNFAIQLRRHFGNNP